MNALNIISSRVIGQPSSTSDDGSSDHILATSTQSSDSSIEATQEEEVSEDKDFRIGGAEATSIPPFLNEDEKVSSLEQWPQYDESAGKGWRFVPRVLVDFTLSTFKWIFSTVAYPAIYLVSCVYDDRGNFSLMLPLRRLRRMFSGGQDRPAAAQAVHTSPGAESHTVAAAQSRASRERRPTSLQRTPTANSSSSSAPSSDSETEIDHSTSAVNNSSPSRHTRSKSQSSISSDDDAAPSRRSIRIRLNNGDGSKAGASGKFSSASGHVERPTSSSSNSPPAISPATLKSPTSPASSLKLTRYPRFPAPPRPLIPKRQPSYAIPDPSISRLVQKTLIIDLDETLIHSLARGGRMSTGHMVEVKLNVTVGVDGTTIGPQHPILYYVHKRPHCDEFLRKVCKWYNLVVFTASVQEYADPVIDWLEQERKYFSGRYYRQHCTFRNGAYIKDVSSVEPDLSKVMILDNSPMSYIFHEDNAIPIEGWINDPTDNDLLHLIPLLEALQYVTDVRALLALRMGEVPPP